MPRRERWSVIGSILDAIDEQSNGQGDSARVTNVATQANVAYDRLLGYLEDLQDAGMVTEERMPQLTDKGKEFLREFRGWQDILERFGLDPPERPS